MVFHDSEECRLSIEYFLTREGYEVFTETFSNEEVLLISAIKPDLVMLDCTNDQLSTGWEIMLRLKLMSETSTIPLVFCIDTTKMEDVKAYLSTKGILLLDNPYDLSDLLLIINRVFEPSHEA